MACEVIFHTLILYFTFLLNGVLTKKIITIFNFNLLYEEKDKTLN
jgi:hypothetical protein